MNRTFLVAGTMLLLGSSLAAQDPWSENFESYAANQSLQGIGGWYGWDNNAASAGTVDSQRSRSFPNSIHIIGTSDAVHPGLRITAGKWTIRAWQFIPTGGLAGNLFFIVNNRYAHGGPYNWTEALRADPSSGTLVDSLRIHTPRPIAFDRWAEYRIDVDLDANTCSNYYDGQLVSTGSWTVGTGGGGPVVLEAIDLYSEGGTCNWDDLSVEWRGDSFDRIAAGTTMFDFAGWSGWNHALAQAGTISNARFRSGPNSLAIGSVTDAIHDRIGIRGGVWEISAWQYIPSGALANGDCWFIMNNEYNHGGPYHWVTQTRTDRTTNTIVDDLRPFTPQPIVFDQWVEYRVVADIDANTCTNYYNGAVLSGGSFTGPWFGTPGPQALENIDLYSTGGTCFWDDIRIREIVQPPCFESRLGTALNLGDDETVAQSLPFSFPFPGGSTNSIGICSNGFIWLDGTQTDADFSNSVAEFLGSALGTLGTPRICAAWRDLDPSSSDDVYFNVFADRAVITWYNVVRYLGSSPMTIQCQMLADGSVYVFYDSAYDPTGATLGYGRTLIGIKAAVGSVADPGNTDFSASVPVSTGNVVYEFFGDSALFDLQGRCIRFVPNRSNSGYEVSFRADCGASVSRYGLGCPAASPLDLSVTGLPTLGATFTWDVSNVSPNALAVALLFGFSNANLSLDPLGWVGCTSYTSIDVSSGIPFTPPTASLPFSVPTSSALVGGSLFGQALEITPTTPHLSNGVRLEIGKN